MDSNPVNGKLAKRALRTDIEWHSKLQAQMRWGVCIDFTVSERRRRRRRRRREVDRRLRVLIWTSLEKTDPSLDLVPFAGTTSVRRTWGRTLVEKIEN